MKRPISNILSFALLLAFSMIYSQGFSNSAANLMAGSSEAFLDNRVMGSGSGAAVQLDLQTGGPSNVITCYNSTSGIGSIQYTMSNNGLDTITSFTVVWLLNSTLDSLTWYGVLNPGQSITIGLGNFTGTPQGTYAIDVWVSTVNGSVDGNPLNDTTTTTYTVGPPLLVNDLQDTSICVGDSVLLELNQAYSSYHWSNGDVTPTMLAFQSGTYVVTITDSNNCISTDSININYFPAPQSILPDDTVACAGYLISLWAASGFNSYLWPDGSTSQSMLTSVSGTYPVTVVDSNGCSYVDDIVVSNIPTPFINVPEEVDFCDGDSATVTAQGGALLVFWNTGNLGTSLTTSVPGTYVVTAIGDNGCESKDTVSLVVHYPQQVDFNDSIICNGAPLTLSTLNQFDDYNWANGDTSPTSVVTQPGIYSVSVSDAYGCASVDSIHVFAHNISISLGGDSLICSGDVIILNVIGTYQNYLWNDGSVNSSYVVSAGGVYALTVTDFGTCSVFDSVEIEEKPIPVAEFTGYIVSPFVSFSNLSNLPSGYTWYFGDGDTSTLFSPAHTYAQSGSYVVSLHAQNECGLDIFSKVFDVFPQGIVNPGSEAKIVLYPTIASDFINLDVEGLVPGEYQYFVHTISGALLQKAVTKIVSGKQTKAIVVSGLAAGTYVLSLVFNNESVFSQQFVHE